MGARGHLLVTLTLALTNAACFDFEEPDLPEAGAPAILQAAIHVSDAGLLHFTATLAPALTLEGLEREIVNDTIVVNGLRFGPRAVRRNGTREYDAETAQAAPAGTPLSLISPRIADVQASPPAVQWPTVQRLDPDSLVYTRGTELMLRARLVGAESPAPQLRSWTVELASTEARFTLGGSGRPPETIRVPPQFVPEAQNGRVTAILTYFQSGVYRPAPGDYLLTLNSDVRVRWLLRLTGTSP